MHAVRTARDRSSRPASRLAIGGVGFLLLTACAGAPEVAAPALVDEPLSAAAAERLFEGPGLIQVADADLGRMRGGLRVNGLDLDIAAQVRTTVAGQFELVSNLMMTDAGRWLVLASRVRSPDGGAAVPALSQQSVGSGEFQAMAGSPATTQVLHQLKDNSIASVISNRVNNETISQSMALTVRLNNASEFASRALGVMSNSMIARDVARFTSR